MLVFVLTALSTASAQRVQRIAATVNDDIVSVFDLESRLRLVVASSGIRVTPALQRRLTQQVLRTLIDERLQMQEAKRRNIAVTKRDMSRAFEALEKQNRLKPGTFEAFVRENRLPRCAPRSPGQNLSGKPFNGASPWVPKKSTKNWRGSSPAKASRNIAWRKSCCRRTLPSRNKRPGGPRSA